MGKSMVSCRFSLKPIHWMLDELNLFFERIQKVDHIDSSVTSESGLVVLSSTVVESELFDFKAYGMRPESLQRRGRRRPPLAKQWSTALLMIRNLLNSTAVMQKKNVFWDVLLTRTTLWDCGILLKHNWAVLKTTVIPPYWLVVSIPNILETTLRCGMITTNYI